MINDYADIQHSTPGATSVTNTPPSFTHLDVINPNPLVHSINNTLPRQHVPTHSPPQPVLPPLTNQDPPHIYHINPPLTSNPIPPPIADHDPTALVRDISNTFSMPHIHPGIYPLLLSPPLLRPSLPLSNLHATGTQNASTNIHADFHTMENVIAYHELYYTVDSQLNMMLAIHCQFRLLLVPLIETYLSTECTCFHPTVNLSHKSHHIHHQQ